MERRLEVFDCLRRVRDGLQNLRDGPDSPGICARLIFSPTAPWLIAHCMRADVLWLSVGSDDVHASGRRKKHTLVANKYDTEEAEGPVSAAISK
jgi:hypothetical protein